MRQRDFQRSKVYRSEKVLYKYTAKIETVSEVNHYLRAVLKKSWIQDIFPEAAKKEIYVKDGRGRGSACCRTGNRSIVISVPKWARKTWVLLHELAHGITWDGERSAHGREFCNAFLMLINKELGETAYNDLIQSFKNNGVKFSL